MGKQSLQTGAHMEPRAVDMFDNIRVSTIDARRLTDVLGFYAS